MLLSYYRRPLFVLLALYAAGLYVFRDRVLKPPPELPFALPRSGVLVTGRVAEYPAAARGGWRFALETDEVAGRPLAAGLMVYARSLGGASYGDTVSFLADLSAARGADVPGGLDWAEYLSRRGIAAEARAADLGVVRPANPAIRLARAVRERSLAAFAAALPPAEAGVFGGVVLGEKRAVPPDLKEAFRDSGAMHLLVASGSNVGFVVAVVYFLCGRLGLRRRPAGLAALALAGLYVLAAGLEAPLVRAYLMFAAGLAAWLLGRESGAFHALTAAALLILLFSPRSLFDAGFQMSFLAAYGLTAGMGAWGRYLKLRGPAGWAAGLLAVSFFAQLFLYPVLAAYFHRVSLVSPLSNMVLVPASAAAMGLGFLLAALSWAGPVFGWLGAAAGVFMAFFIRAVGFFAGLPFSAASVTEPSAAFIAGAFAVAFALAHAPLLGFRRPRLYAAAAAGLALMAAGPLGAAFAPAPRQGALLFGDSDTRSALLRGPAGGLFLMNPGVNGRKLALAVLDSGAGGVEAVLLSSLERKDYAGLAELAGQVRVKRVLLPYGPRPEGLRLALAALEKGGAEVTALWPGEPGPGGVTCGWDGYSPGYSGRGDSYSWTVGVLKLSRGGARAELGTETAEAVRGAVVPIGAPL